MTTTYGSISQRTAAWASNEMLEHAEPILVLQKFADPKPIPKNKADNAKFRRPIPFTVSTVPAQEGVTPTAQAMQYEDVSVTLQQYIGICEISDKVNDLCEDPVLKDAAMLSGEQAAETLEMVLYGALKGGTNLFRANGSARTDINTVITLTKQRAIVRALEAQRAKPVTSMISASTNIATEPVSPGFIAFCHTDCESDIRGLAGFVPVEKYGQMKALPYEIGKVEKVRYICSPLLTPYADGGGDKGSMKSTTGVKADVYPIIYISAKSYAVTPLKGAGAIIPGVINPGDISKSDPAGQRGYVSWKTWFAALITNQLWVGRLEAAVTAL